MADAVFECTTCGAAVVNRARHTAWHREQTQGWRVVRTLIMKVFGRG